jgi:hypothetical protein
LRGSGCTDFGLAAARIWFAEDSVCMCVGGVLRWLSDWIVVAWATCEAHDYFVDRAKNPITDTHKPPKLLFYTIPTSHCLVLQQSSTTFADLHHDIFKTIQISHYDWFYSGDVIHPTFKAF